MPILNSGGGNIIRGRQHPKKIRINKRSNELQGSKKSVTLYSLIVDDTINDMYVSAVGTHVVRINKDVTVSAGDLLVSNGDGTAKKFGGDTSMTADVYSSIIGKVLTNIKQETYSDGSYTVPCALYCG